MINILYQSPWPIGGSTSYTVHLSKTLGRSCRVVRLGKKTENKKRQIGNYGVFYQIVSLPDLLRETDPILIAASDPSFDLNAWVQLGKKKNTWCVFHDPNEFRLYPHWKYVDTKRVICIRETGLRHMQYGVFIPHPYVRCASVDFPEKTKLAVSLARTSSIKNSDWILRSNRHLPKRMHVELCGSVNRMWQNFYLKNAFPEFKESVPYPRTFGYGVGLCMPAKYMVDLTIFKDDGGGTQYTILEAIDAGTIPILTKDWCGYPGPAKRISLQVNLDALPVALKEWDKADMSDMQKRNYRYLEKTHSEKIISDRYLRALT